MIQQYLSELDGSYTPDNMKKVKENKKKTTIYASDNDYFRINGNFKKFLCFFLHVPRMSYRQTMSSLIQEQGFIHDLVQF